MARQPKVDLGSLIQPENVTEVPIPETEPDPKPSVQETEVSVASGKNPGSVLFEQRGTPPTQNYMCRNR